MHIPSQKLPRCSFLYIPNEYSKHVVLVWISKSFCWTNFLEMFTHQFSYFLRKVIRSGPTNCNKGKKIDCEKYELSGLKADRNIRTFFGIEPGYSSFDDGIGTSVKFIFPFDKPFLICVYVERKQIIVTYIPCRNLFF